MTVNVGGHNVTAPLVQALPGVLAPCPTGGTTATAGLSASVLGLVGACVRATAQPPMEASVLVLDTELIGRLTAAGVPLNQVVVSCPAGVASGQPGTPGHGGGGPTPSVSGPAAAGSAGPGTKPTAASRAPRGVAGTCASLASSGSTTLNSHTLASVLPGNIPQTLPWILLALALLGRRRLGRVVHAVRGIRSQPSPTVAVK
ncbi:uncharacterized protein (TIGR03382 family) [Phycicoccus badiiscoriae]|uniref:Uncharacterized protein (TIGR03382 family) n=1 Tax=Pedococcus badiiscoriae TaxID=642776 RepID=A0A852WIN7_9MICO|nr:hypothetical protein [Pedococcus badiiscoriae]NYG06135.1 uncharacterized protein (TIGR03382 family) [Pedococcus badiiscoriae]